MVKLMKREKARLRVIKECVLKKDRERTTETEINCLIKNN